MLSDLLRWKRQPDGSGNAPRPKGEESVLPTKALPKFLAAIGQQPDSPLLLDLGPVIGSNVEFFGERLGCKLFIEDLFADYDRHVRASTLPELSGAIASRFRHDDQSVDGVLCWDFFDFLDKTAVQALAHQIVRMLRPGGAVMGFFTTTAADRAPFTKYEVVDDASLRHRHHAGAGGRKHVLANRDIINAFEGLIVAESFLLKNNTREILLRRKA
ncbi:MAG: class I SAM-dependent methyltransferase [Acidobacteria bacterium]|nr:class I SAM-dependent methyltransferase [Acidobacteriota bacterium]MBA3884313.1 class I SAM-dependent methyltransferase [Acidobacteriota bacterium]